MFKPLWKEEHGDKLERSVSSEHRKLEGDEANKVGRVRPCNSLNIMLRIFVSAKEQCKGMECLNRGMT